MATTKKQGQGTLARVTKKVKDAANSATKETKKVGKAVARKAKEVLSGSPRSRKKTTAKKRTAKSASK
jgi:hypothetical protein